MYFNFNKFMYNQTKHQHRKHFCMYCLQCFNSRDVLNNHKTNCMVINGQQAIKIREKDNNILQFTNFHKQMPVPFVIYADFEDITEKVQGCQPNNDKLYTETFQNHKDCGYGDIRLFVVLIINIPNQLKFIEEKMLYTNSWRRC